MDRRKYLLILCTAFLAVLAALLLWMFDGQSDKKPPHQNPPPPPIAPAPTSTTAIHKASSTVGMKTYTNTEFGFEFEIPEGWSFHENTFGSPYSKFNLVGASPEENKLPNPIFPSLLVNIVTPDFADRAAKSLEKLEFSKSAIVVADIQGIKYVYVYESVQKISIILSVGEYSVIFGAQKEYEDAFNKIISSFRFLK